LLIDLRLEGKAVVVFGGGATAERKIETLLEHGASINVVSRDFTPSLLYLARDDRIELIETSLDEHSPVIIENVTGAAVVIAATNSPEINTAVSRAARDAGALVCAVDMPAVSDFYFPALARRGSIRVGICTDGRSPLMSRLIKEKVEVSLTDEDAFNVELQAHARELAKEHLAESSLRRDVLYRIARDPEIQTLISEGKIDDAKILAGEMVKRG